MSPPSSLCSLGSSISPPLLSLSLLILTLSLYPSQFFLPSIDETPFYHPLLALPRCQSYVHPEYHGQTDFARLRKDRSWLPSARTSKRFSTVSGSPSVASSLGNLPSGDPRIAEFHNLRDGLERLENKPLQKQRFVPTPEKSDNLSKLALGAKVERALGRRMTGQDAVMRKPVLNEKTATESSQ
ncbi:conserved hypothetical protein [Aspergillus terreus NIH2624]|uniref:Uncharacterized protein n=1 Tax=Aspergillus terreus (strain NIH 2624 / FGSC A1156) TaxID=341663 RepID=Q0CE86_ASPTN|nr:uncharacterized protein ATEG_07998 [Aspergillus terreus NIH2624]EAU31171.1 conserved hypothetical protein [Aspergillus terreus NIH2624]